MGASHPLDGVPYGHIRDEAQRFSAIVIVTPDDREKGTVLEDDCLGVLRVPLGPWDPKAILTVGVKVIGKPDNVVPYFTWPERVNQVGRVSLEASDQPFSFHQGVEKYTHRSDERRSLVTLINFRRSLVASSRF